MKHFRILLTWRQIARPRVSPMMVDVDRLHLLQAAAFDSFNKTLTAMSAAA